MTNNSSYNIEKSMTTIVVIVKIEIEISAITI